MENKNKYTKEEVMAIVGECERKRLDDLAEERGVINELKDELKRVSAELDAYKNRDSLIGATLKSAEEKAEEIVRTAEIKYATELDRLAVFKERWNRYFRYLAETYPHAAAVQQASRLLAALDEVLGKNVASRDKIDKLDGMLKDVHVEFDPKAKIESYIAATENTESESEFDMDAVLNPGKLDLEDLCKELGLMGND